MADDLRRRIWFSLGALALVRLGTLIPIPGIDPLQVAEFFALQAGSGVLGLFDMFVGGALGRMSVLALGLIPYFAAFVMVRLLTAFLAPVKALERQGEKGRKRVYQYVRLSTLLLAMFQSYGFAVALESSGNGVVLQPGLWFKLTAVCTLTAGSLLLMWLAEQIDHRGLGLGAFLIVASGIAANMLAAIANLIELNRLAALDAGFLAFLAVVVLGLVICSATLVGARRIVIVVRGRADVRTFRGQSSRISIDISPAGLAPLVAAVALLVLIPGMAELIAPGVVAAGLWPTQLLYVAFFFLLLSLLSILLTPAMVDTKELAERLEQTGNSILGIRPGKNTAEYLDYVIRRLALLGGLLTALICALPELLRVRYDLPAHLGGASLLILTFVTMSLIRQIRAYRHGGGPPPNLFGGAMALRPLIWEAEAPGEGLDREGRRGAAAVK